MSETNTPAQESESVQSAETATKSGQKGAATKPPKANDDNIFNDFGTGIRVEEEQGEMSLQEYLELCSEDATAYATATQRLLDAIGEPEIVDTSKNSRLGRIFGNRTIRTYPAFSDFYGMEAPIEKMVQHIKHSAQGLEESRQVLYLLGPVGGGKSSLVERLKELMEDKPIYALKHGDQVSPIYENPLGLFDKRKDGDKLKEKFGIPKRAIRPRRSPWANKRIRENVEAGKHPFDGFSVVKLYPSEDHGVAVADCEPGDENNQDVSTLIGKNDIRFMDQYRTDDPDAYVPGALGAATEGLLNFIEMFKAPLKSLNPILSSVQDTKYQGNSGVGTFPFWGKIAAHSNESEWESFKGNRNNEAFLDRVDLIRVPYNLRVTEEKQIYRKILDDSELANAPCAPHTLDLLAQFSVMTRLKKPENSSLWTKMRVYDGENIKDEVPDAKTVDEYRDAAGVTEGMDGMSTRFAYKVLSRTFNFAADAVEADPIHLMYVLEQAVMEEQMDQQTEEKYLGLIRENIRENYKEVLAKEIQRAYVESYADYGQNLFDKYVAYADAWVDNNDYKDPDTGEVKDREALDAELQKTEKPAGIRNAKDFRNEVVKHALRHRAQNNGANPDWRDFRKFRDVLEKRMFDKIEDMLPIISFGKKASQEQHNKHQDFVERMKHNGYSESQVRRVVDFYMKPRQG